jgi:hypothetical protein
LNFKYFQDSEYNLKNNEKEVPGPDETAFESIDRRENAFNDEKSMSDIFQADRKRENILPEMYEMTDSIGQQIIFRCRPSKDRGKSPVPLPRGLE